jgi:hypothetical protein
LYVAAATEPTQVQRSDHKRLNEVKRARAALEAGSPLSLTRRVIVKCVRERCEKRPSCREVLTFIAPKAAEI